MKHSTKRPTKAEAQRMARLKEMPCIACSMGFYPRPQFNRTEVHHLLSGKRQGHMFTIPLCGWHHRAEPLTGRAWSATVAEEQSGPSLKLTSKAFHERFGSDAELLELTNRMLEKHHVL